MWTSKHEIKENINQTTFTMRLVNMKSEKNPLVWSSKQEIKENIKIKLCFQWLQCFIIFCALTSTRSVLKAMAITKRIIRMRWHPIRHHSQANT